MKLPTQQLSYWSGSPLPARVWWPQPSETLGRSLDPSWGRHTPRSGLHSWVWGPQPYPSRRECKHVPKSEVIPVREAFLTHLLQSPSYLALLTRYAKRLLLKSSQGKTIKNKRIVNVKV